MTSRGLSVERLLRAYGAAKARLFTYCIRSAFGSFGSSSVVCPPFRFANLRYVHLQNNVTINRDCWIHALGSVARNPSIVIGPNTGVGMGATISAAKSVILGKEVMLARNVYISDHSHAYGDPNVPISLQGITEPKGVLIDDGAWLGQNVCILPGVRVGKGAIVGANSVVTRDVPDLSIAVGAPAVIVKQYNAVTQQWAKCARG